MGPKKVSAAKAKAAADAPALAVVPIEASTAFSSAARLESNLI